MTPIAMIPKTIMPRLSVNDIALFVGVGIQVAAPLVADLARLQDPPCLLAARLRSSWRRKSDGGDHAEQMTGDRYEQLRDPSCRWRLAGRGIGSGLTFRSPCLGSLHRLSWSIS